MPILSKMTEEEIQKLLSTKNNAPIQLTPEEKLEKLLINRAKKGILTRRFHFNAIENGTKLVLFDGNKKKHAEFTKDIDGVRKARIWARKLFLNSPTVYRNGGFKFDCFMVDEFGAMKDEKE